MFSISSISPFSFSFYLHTYHPQDPTCRTCSDYPCTCGQAIGVPIFNGEDNPMTIRVFGSMTPILYDDYLGASEEAKEREKAKKKKFEEERRARVLGWIHSDDPNKEIANIYLTHAARKVNSLLFFSS